MKSIKRLRPEEVDTAKRKYIANKLEKCLRKTSYGCIPKRDRIFLAKRTANRLDFSNSFQMHKSIEGYADMLAESYFSKKKAR